MMKSFRMLAALGLLALGLGAAFAQEDTFSVTILHTNDTHAAHAPNSAGDGGVSRQAAVQSQVLAEGGNVLILDAGDRFTGTLFHTVFLGQDQVQIMNSLGYQAMALGNHEFDNGEETLAAFISGVNFPVLAANIDVSETVLADLVKPYAVIEVGGQQVGVIGLVTADTVDSSSPSDAITFSEDYAGVANAAAAELMAQGINKIVLLTHTGFNVDGDFLTSLTNIDVVLGGHSHTLLSNAYNAGVSAYPTLFENAETGETIYYAQAGANNTFLGRLNLTFDADGVVQSAAGDVILLSRYITPDPALEAIVQELSGPVEELRNQPLKATAEVDLSGDRRVCRVEECDLGNLIADAMRAATGAQIAIMNGGGVRRDIAAGDITLGEALEVQPFGNLLATFQATGADLRAALENGVSRLALTEAGQVARDGGAGRFPQVSGMRYTIDPTQEAGSRIVSVEVLQADGSFAPLDDAAVYSVVTNNFVRQGGDGYEMFATNAIDPYDFGNVDYAATVAYMETLGTIGSQVDPANPRISYVNAEVEPNQ